MPGKKVYVKKVGNAVVLLPVERPWETLFESLGEFSRDFMEEREQPPMQTRENALE